MASKSTSSLPMEASNSDKIFQRLSEGDDTYMEHSKWSSLMRNARNSRMSSIHQSRTSMSAHSLISMQEDVLDSPDVIAKFLKEVPFLSRLSGEDRMKVAEVLKFKSWEDGELIIRQGDKGDEFFIIKGGQVQVKVANNGEEKVVGVLTSMDYFGEVALMSGEVRNATIVAQTHVTTLSLGRSDFEDLFGPDKLKVTFGKRKAIGGFGDGLRLKDLTEKSAATKALIKKAINNNVLFENFSEEQLKDLIRLMTFEEIPNGKRVIQEGDPGDYFYVVESGIFNVYQKEEGKPERLINTRTEEESFGEYALIYNAPRSASVEARTNCRVWKADRLSFKRNLVKLSEEKIQEYESFLTRPALLHSLLNRERKAIAEVLDEMRYEADDIIADCNNTFYIIRSGAGGVYKTKADGHGAQEHDVVGPGDFFGMHTKYTTHADENLIVHVQGGPMTCLCLDGKTFNQILGPILDILKLEGIKTRRSGTKEKIRLEELNIMRKLGVGRFGIVHLVEHKSTGEMYALKELSKGYIKQNESLGHLMREKNTCILLEHPFIIKLHSTMQDQQKCYFLLELSPGGELFKLLKNQPRFSHDRVRFYTASVALAFEHMHDRGIIYRDLKPENILLNQDGYVKMTDFGLCKIVGNRKTFTLCGTPDYLAPEVVRGEGHDYGVDWWTLGILVFEMLTGDTPFQDHDPMKVLNKIIHHHFKTPSYIDKRSARKLIRSFLQPESRNRLGMSKHGVRKGVQKIKDHIYFRDTKEIGPVFDWEALADQKMKAPYIPEPVKTDSSAKPSVDVGECDTVVEYESDGEGLFDEF